MRASLTVILIIFTAAPAYAQQHPPVENDVRTSVSGLVLLNTFYTDAPTNNADAPWLALPPDPAATLPAHALGGTVRQSRIVLNGEVDRVLGGSFTGTLEVDFYGGHASGERLSPLPRIRRAVGHVKWSGAWMTFGQDALPVSPLNPSTLASLGVPAFTGAGNLSNWMPQIRLGLAAGRELQLGIETAAVAPQLSDSIGGVETQPDRAERSRRPFFQARVLARWGGDSRGELSVGGHYGWFTRDSDQLLESRAVAASARFFITPHAELRGEFFAGEALDMLGGGGVGQNLTPAGGPLRTRGGWFQVLLHFGPEWELGGGYGIENPDDVDVDPISGRTRNLSWESHVQWRTQPLVVGLEFRRLETTYANPNVGVLTANHLNWAIGFEF